MVQREVADRFFAEPVDQGVRRRFGARPARGAPHGLPPGGAHRLPAAAERRLGPRGVPARAAPRRLRPRQGARRGLVRASPQDAPELGRAGRAGAARTSSGGARGDRAAAGDPRRGARAGRVRRARGARCESAPAPAKINLALVVGPARDGRQARGRDGPPAHRPRRPRLDRAGRRRSPSTGFPATPSSATRSPRSPRPRASSRAGARRSRSGSRSQPASAAAAPMRRRRSGSRTRRSSAARCPTSFARSRRRSAPTSRSSWPTARSSARGDGSQLEPLDLPQDYWIVLALPHGATKESTAAVYSRFDERAGAEGWEERQRGAGARARRASTGRAISRRSRRTTSRLRRSPPSCARSAPSAPTSAARARRSTGSSITGGTPAPRGVLFGAPPAPGSRFLSGTGDRLTVRVCVVDRPLTIEHGSNRFGRALREHRLKLALGLAVVEGVLVLAGEIDVVGRRPASRSPQSCSTSAAAAGRGARRSGRERGSSPSRSCAVVLVPVLALVLTAFAVVALVILAIVALVILLLDRR